MKPIICLKLKFYFSNFLATNIFNLIGTDYFGDFFRENLNAWVQNYGFKYYLRQKTQAEAKENKIIAQFIGVLLCFQP